MRLLRFLVGISYVKKQLYYFIVIPTKPLSDGNELGSVICCARTAHVAELPCWTPLVSTAQALKIHMPQSPFRHEGCECLPTSYHSSSFQRKPLGLFCFTCRHYTSHPHLGCTPTSITYTTYLPSIHNRLI